MMRITELSLDEIIKAKKMENGRAKGRRSLPLGGLHRAQSGRVSKKGDRHEKEMWNHDAFLQMEEEDRKTKVLRRSTSAKVDIANLGSQVSTDDLIELFGCYNLIKANVHYDEGGQSLGTANAEFASVGDATRMMKKFVGLKLDGRLLKMTLVGGIVPRSAPITSRLTGGGLSRGRMERGGGRGGMNKRQSAPAGWEHDSRLLSDKDGDSDGGRRGQTAFGKRGGEAGGNRGDKKRVMTEAQLDAELDAYMKKPAKMET